MELTINDKGFTGITELNDNFVFLHPTDKKLRKGILHSKVEMGVPIPASSLLKTEYSFRPFQKNRNFVLRLLNQLKVLGKGKYIVAMQINQYIESNKSIITIITANFGNNFYNISPDNDQVLVKVENVGDLPLNKDLIFKYVTVNLSGHANKLPVFFKPSKYLDNEKEIWKLISILGEKDFSKHLFDNNFIVNENFVSEAFKHSPQVFYLSSNKKKVFSSRNERFDAKYGPLNEISLSDLLEKTTVSKIEEVLEKSETDI